MLGRSSCFGLSLAVVPTKNLPDCPVYNSCLGYNTGQNKPPFINKFPKVINSTQFTYCTKMKYKSI